MRLVIFVIVLLMAGCSYGVKKKEGLLDRVKGYWTAIVSQNYSRSYVYEYPLYRKLVPKAVYISRMAGGGIVVIRNFRIEGVEQRGNRAIVTLILDMIVKPPFAKKGLEVKPKREDIWVKFNGVWYHVPKEYERLKGIGR